MAEKCRQSTQGDDKGRNKLETAPVEKSNGVIHVHSIPGKAKKSVWYIRQNGQSFLSLRKDGRYTLLCIHE